MHLPGTGLFPCLVAGFENTTGRFCAYSSPERANLDSHEGYSRDWLWSANSWSELIRMSPETKAILRAAMNRFELDRDGIHGVAHWGRVRANGFRLAQLTGANVYVVELFALIHDSCRIDDGHDPEHGLRAAGFAERKGSVAPPEFRWEP